jgi:hypothetical protein
MLENGRDSVGSPQHEYRGSDRHEEHKDKRARIHMRLQVSSPAKILLPGGGSKPARLGRQLRSRADLRGELVQGSNLQHHEVVDVKHDSCTPIRARWRCVVSPRVG